MDNELHNSDRLNIVQQLYDEAGATAPSNTDAKRLAAERQAMSEAKFLLDRGRKERPDVEVIDGIVAAANVPAGRRIARRDRRPLPLLAGRVIPMRMAIAACTLFVAIGIGYVVVDQGPPAVDGARLSMEPALKAESSDEFAAKRATALADRAGALGADMPSEAEQRKDADVFANTPVLPGARTERRLASAPAVQQEPPVVAQRRLTEWNELDNMVVLRRRIDRLNEAAATMEWDDAAVPLEMLPVDSALVGADGGAMLRLVGAPKSKN